MLTVLPIILAAVWLAGKAAAPAGAVLAEEVLIAILISLVVASSPARSVHHHPSGGYTGKHYLSIIPEAKIGGREGDSRCRGHRSLSQ
jgi:hypothetical protein